MHPPPRLQLPQSSRRRHRGGGAPRPVRSALNAVQPHNSASRLGGTVISSREIRTRTPGCGVSTGVRPLPSMAEFALPAAVPSPSCCPRTRARGAHCPPALPGPRFTAVPRVRHARLCRPSSARAPELPTEDAGRAGAGRTPGHHFAGRHHQAGPMVLR